MAVDSTLIKGGRVYRDLSMKSWVCQLRFAKGTTGGLADPNYFFDSKVTITLDDHTSTARCVFVGYFPSQTATYIPADNSEEFTGYSYGMKASQQRIDDLHLILLSPTDAGSVSYQRMDYVNITHQFHPGKILLGGTSQATAQIAATPGIWLYSADGTESYLCQSSELVLRNVSGTFQDGEAITEIAGTGAAEMSGALSPLDFAPASYYPEAWLLEMLGRDNWENKSGLYPYRINPVGDSGGTWVPKPYDTWDFPDSMNFRQAADQLAEYHNFIFFDWWNAGVIDADVYTPCAYFVHQDDIDSTSSGNHNGLSIPAAVAISASTDTYLVGNVTLDIIGEGRINQVLIRGQGLDGTWYESERVSGTTESAGVFGDGEIPQTYWKTDPNLISQADVNTAAALYYAYLSQRAAKYHATFRQRVDFQLLQLLTFSGYTEIPNGQYRIVRIEYEWNEGGAVFVNVDLVPSAQFTAGMATNRIYVNPTVETQRTIRAEIAKQKLIEVGTVTATDTNTITGTTEGGQTKISRIKS